MSDFIDFRSQDLRLDPSYLPRTESYVSDQAALRRNRPSRSSRHTQASVASNGTWVPYPQQPPAVLRVPSPTFRQTQADSYTSSDAWVPMSYPPPPEPIRVPPPVMDEHLMSDRDDHQFEYMPVDQYAAAEEMGETTSPTTKRKRSGPLHFVGGFVTGLRKLPKAVLRGYGRGRTAVQPEEIDSPLPPRYEPSLRPEVNSLGAHYAHGVDMPVEGERPTSTATHPSHRSLTPRASNTYDTHLQAAPESQTAAIHPDPKNTPDDTTVVHQDPLSNPAMPAAGPPDLASPVLRPTSDYDKMTTPPHTPSAPSIASYLTRVHRFLKELNGLPWVAPSSGRVAADYIPGDNPRSRYKYYRYRERQANKLWYTSRTHQDVDLLSEGERATPMTRSPRTTRTTFDGRGSNGGGSRAVRSPRRTRTTGGQGSRSHAPARSHSHPHSHPRSHVASRSGTVRSGSDTVGQSPRSPSHSHLAYTDPATYAQVSYPYGYTYSPSPPQPLYLFPSSPNMRAGQVQPGQPPMQQAMPFYLVAGITPSPPPPPHPLPSNFAPHSPQQQQQQQQQQQPQPQQQQPRSGDDTPRAGSPQ